MATKATKKTDAQVIHGLTEVLKNDGLGHQLRVVDWISEEWITQDGKKGLAGVVDVFDQKSGRVVGQFELNSARDLVIGVRGDGLIDALAAARNRRREDLVAGYEARRAAFCATNKTRRAESRGKYQLQKVRQ